ncbi:MAG: hypothetical protein ACK5JM_11825 [Rhodoblastus sp.]
MTKIVTVLGVIVALSLGVIAWMGSDVIAGEGRKDACAPGHVAVDDGYGVASESGCIKL